MSLARKIDQLCKAAMALEVARKEAVKMLLQRTSMRMCHRRYSKWLSAPEEAKSSRSIRLRTWPQRRRQSSMPSMQTGRARRTKARISTKVEELSPRIDHPCKTERHRRHQCRQILKNAGGRPHHPEAYTETKTSGVRCQQPKMAHLVANKLYTAGTEPSERLMSPATQACTPTLTADAAILASPASSLTKSTDKITVGPACRLQVSGSSKQVPAKDFKMDLKLAAMQNQMIILPIWPRGGKV